TALLESPAQKVPSDHLLVLLGDAEFLEVAAGQTVKQAAPLAVETAQTRLAHALVAKPIAVWSAGQQTAAFERGQLLEQALLRERAQARAEWQREFAGVYRQRLCNPARSFWQLLHQAIERALHGLRCGSVEAGRDLPLAGGEMKAAGGDQMASELDAE